MIPKIIIQTYKSKDQIPNDVQVFIQKIQKYNPDFNYMFFDDNDIDQFMKEKFPEYLDKFNSFKYTIQKIDFFRYLAVYYYGGFYFDIDVEPYRQLDDLLKYKCVFPIEFDLNTIILFYPGIVFPT